MTHSPRVVWTREAGATVARCGWYRLEVRLVSTERERLLAGQGPDDAWPWCFEVVDRGGDTIVRGRRESRRDAMDAAEAKASESTIVPGVRDAIGW